MKKSFNKIISAILLIALMCSISVMFVGCKKEEPYFEIRLYDDNWVELERGDNTYNPLGYSYISHLIFEYDGEPKGYNAIAYKDGKAFARYTYKDDRSDPEGIFSVTESSSNWPTPPVNKGKHQLTYKFDTSNMVAGQTFDTEIGIIEAIEFPPNLWTYGHFEII